MRTSEACSLATQRCWTDPSREANSFRRLAMPIARRNSFPRPRTDCAETAKPAMPNLLPIEGDWQHLIEKRSGKDRRVKTPPAAKKPAADKRRRSDRRKSRSQGK